MLLFRSTAWFLGLRTPVLAGLVLLALAVATPVLAVGDVAPAPAPSPLAGITVAIDPGHNPGNFRHSNRINRLVDAGTHRKACDTTRGRQRMAYALADALVAYGPVARS